MGFIEAIGSYRKNLSTAFSFAILLVFVLPFVWLSNTIVSSGTTMIDYGFLRDNPIDSLLLLLTALLFLYFYSLFVCLIVFSVRRDLSEVRVSHFLNEKIHAHALKYFVFLSAFTIIGAVLSAILVSYGVPPIWLNLVIFLVSSSFLFLSQTIVVDEESLGASVASNWDFISRHPRDFLAVMLFGIVSVFALQLVEFMIDYVVLVGNFVSLFIGLVFLVPFIEVLKTRIYMERFSLIKNYHSPPGSLR
ncbi:MAG: hypothetical protein NUV67_01265 [archaeon]|nr:hypothetical protein [archaeon]